MGDLSYSESQPECPPTLWYSSKFNASKFTLHILSNASGGFQIVNYILLMLLMEIIPRLIYIKIYHRPNNHGKCVEGIYYSMINNKDSHLPSPLIMFTCTVLLHALLEWQKNKGVHPKASKSKLNADRPDCSIYFSYKNDDGKIASCCTVTGRK